MSTTTTTDTSVGLLIRLHQDVDGAYIASDVTGLRFGHGANPEVALAEWWRQVLDLLEMRDEEMGEPLLSEARAYRAAIDAGGVSTTATAERSPQELALQGEALLAERDAALSSLEELAESAERYRQAVEGRVAVLEAALRDLLDALVNSPPSIVGDPWATKVGAAASRARAVLEVANYREPRPARAQPDSRVVVEGE